MRSTTDWEPTTWGTRQQHPIKRRSNWACHTQRRGPRPKARAHVSLPAHSHRPTAAHQSRNSGACIFPWEDDKSTQLQSYSPELKRTHTQRGTKTHNQHESSRGWAHVVWAQRNCKVFASPDLGSGNRIHSCHHILDIRLTALIHIFIDRMHLSQAPHLYMYIHEQTDMPAKHSLCTSAIDVTQGKRTWFGWRRAEYSGASHPSEKPPIERYQEQTRKFTHRSKGILKDVGGVCHVDESKRALIDTIRLILPLWKYCILHFLHYPVFYCRVRHRVRRHVKEQKILLFGRQNTLFDQIFCQSLANIPQLCTNFTSNGVERSGYTLEQHRFHQQHSATWVTHVHSLVLN